MADDGEWQIAGGEEAPSSQKTMTKRFKQWKPSPKGGVFPLKWSLWLDEFDRSTHKPGMSKNQFAESLVKRGDFHTMNQLCSLWNDNTDERGYPPPECNLFIFVEGIVPVWEDPANRLGGHWVCTIHKNEKKAEQLWYSLLMTIVCGQFPGRYFQEINGIVISPRGTSVRVYVWNKHSLNSKYKENMKSFISDSLDIPQHWMRYNTHKHKVYVNNAKTEPKKPKSHGKGKAFEGEKEDHQEEEEEEEEEDKFQGGADQANTDQREDLEDEGAFLASDEAEEPAASLDEVEEIEGKSASLERVEQSDVIPRTVVQAIKPAQQARGGLLSPFSLSVGFAIFLALLYNIYILAA